MKPALAFFRLLCRASVLETLTLLMTMILASLSEGIGLLLLVPVLDTLSGSAQAETQLASIANFLGLAPSLSVLLSLFVGLVALRASFVYAQQIMSSRYQANMVDRMRMQGFASLFAAEWRWLAERRASDHAAILISGIGRVAVGLSQALALLVSSSTLLACLAVAFLLSWQAASIVTACAVLGLAALLSHRRHALNLGVAMSQANRVLQASLDAGFSGLRLTKIVDGCKRRIEQIDGSMKLMRLQQERLVAATAGARMVVQVASAGILALVVYVATAWWHVSFAALVILVAVFARSAALLLVMQQQYHHWLHAIPALEDVDRLLADAHRAAEPAAGAIEPPRPALSGAIALHGITYTHPGRLIPALNDISLAIAPGSLTALVGASGAGKSSLADLLIGLVTPDEGTLTVDGTAVAGSARLGWRRCVGYVEQNAFFFHDTIRNNLLFAAPDASEEQINTALALAAAAFVHQLPAGLETVIGDRGLLLSGGERQRLALARALLSKPQFLILDEATHALDPVNETIIWATVEKLRGTCTIVAIGHHLPILDRADEVIILESGRIVAQRPGEAMRVRGELAA
ncbi:MAG: ABC transporter ATP-binding protein [Hyphomicrobiales bacterium]